MLTRLYVIAIRNKTDGSIVSNVFTTESQAKVMERTLTQIVGSNLECVISDHEIDIPVKRVKKES